MNSKNNNEVYNNLKKYNWKIHKSNQTDISNGNSIKFKFKPKTFDLASIRISDGSVEKRHLKAFSNTTTEYNEIYCNSNNTITLTVVKFYYQHHHEEENQDKQVIEFHFFDTPSVNYFSYFSDDLLEATFPKKHIGTGGGGRD